MIDLLFVNSLVLLPLRNTAVQTSLVAANIAQPSLVKEDFGLQDYIAVDDNIQKARRAFFALGSTGLFQGRLNPLTARDLCETCVFPVLLFGCEN